MKKRYYVTDVELTKNGHYGDYLSWIYAGVRYEAFGEFFVDNKGYLHHTFTTSRGKEIEITIKY